MDVFILCVTLSNGSVQPLRLMSGQADLVTRFRAYATKSRARASRKNTSSLLLDHCKTCRHEQAAQAAAAAKPQNYVELTKTSCVYENQRSRYRWLALAILILLTLIVVVLVLLAFFYKLGPFSSSSSSSPSVSSTGTVSSYSCATTAWLGPQGTGVGSSGNVQSSDSVVPSSTVITNTTRSVTSLGNFVAGQFVTIAGRGMSLTGEILAATLTPLPRMTIFGLSSSGPYQNLAITGWVFYPLVPSSSGRHNSSYYFFSCCCLGGGVQLSFTCSFCVCSGNHDRRPLPIEQPRRGLLRQHVGRCRLRQLVPVRDRRAVLGRVLHHGYLRRGAHSDARVRASLRRRRQPPQNRRKLVSLARNFIQSTSYTPPVVWCRPRCRAPMWSTGWGPRARC